MIDGLSWIASTRSSPSGNWVEVAFLPYGGVALRESKDPEGPALIYTKAEWDAFIAGARDREFDPPA